MALYKAVVHPYLMVLQLWSPISKKNCGRVRRRSNIRNNFCTVWKRENLEGYMVDVCKTMSSVKERIGIDCCLIQHKNQRLSSETSKSNVQNKKVILSTMGS